MRIGFFAISISRSTSPDWIRTIATTAERWDSRACGPEHVVLLDRYASKYPYSSGEFPAPTDSINDPFTTLASRPRTKRSASRPVSAWCRSTIRSSSLSSPRSTC